MKAGDRRGFKGGGGGGGEVRVCVQLKSCCSGEVEGRDDDGGGEGGEGGHETG